jgi:glycine/serine hydroxymethyltransferase
MKEAEMRLIAGWIDGALRNRADEAAVARIREEVFALTARFGIPE